MSDAPTIAADGRKWLQKLLGPTSLDLYFERYWEREHLWIPAHASASYEDLLPLGQFDAYLSRNDVRYPAIKIVKSARNVPLNDYARQIKLGSYASDGLIDMDLVADAYRKGGTVVVQLMEKSFVNLAVFSEALGAFFQTGVAVHGFLTPPGAQGLGAHYDTASAFLIQLRGSKRWRLFGLEVEAPTPDQTFDASKPIKGEPLDEIMLRAGDVVYIPRGLPHEGLTVDEESLHLTVVVAPKTWIDIFASILRECQKSEEFRKAPSELIIDAIGDPGMEEKWAKLVGRFNSAATLGTWRSVNETSELVSPASRLGRWI